MYFYKYSEIELQIYDVEHPEISGYYLYLPTNNNPPSMSSNPTPWVWSDYFYYQSYEGLQDSSVFMDLFPPNSIDYYYYNKYIQLGANVFQP